MARFFLLFSSSILLTACSTMVNHHITSDIKSLNPPKLPANVDIYLPHQRLDRNFKDIGAITISDTGFSVGCGYNEVLNQLRKKTFEAGADGAYVYELNEPSILSTCYRLKANLFVYTSPNEFPHPNGGSVSKSGTGFLITENLVATNWHVIQGGSKINILSSKGENFEAKVFAKDKVNDLAILSIENHKFPRPQYKFKRDHDVETGEQVFTIGFPLAGILGKSAKLSSGIISAKEGIDGDLRAFQISNPIQPGNSGGPLFDTRGNLVGVVVATLNANYLYSKTETLPQNVNFAVKATYLDILLQSKTGEGIFTEANKTKKTVSELNKKFEISVFQIIVE